MTTDERYVPSEDLVIEAWKRYSGAQDAKYARLSGGDAGDEARRFLARVRRDAAREALGGYAAQFDASAAAHGRAGLRICQISAESDAWRVRRYRDRNYPEETP